jgi:hypothetical protein
LKERGLLSQATEERTRRINRLLEIMGISFTEQVREIAKEAGVEPSDLDADVLIDLDKRAALEALFVTEEEREVDALLQETERVYRRVCRAREWVDRKKALREAEGGDEGPEEDPEGDPDEEDTDEATDPDESSEGPTEDSE